MDEKKFIISEESKEIMKKIGEKQKEQFYKTSYSKHKESFNLSKGEILSIFAASVSLIIFGGQVKNFIKENNEMFQNKDIPTNIHPKVTQEVQDILNKSNFCEDGKISIKNHEINGNIAKIEYECKEIKNSNESPETGTIGMHFPIQSPHPIPAPF